MDNYRKSEFSDFSGRMLVYAQCGYRFVKGDEGFVIKATEDIIHRDCFIDYTEDNISEFADTVDF